MSPSNPKSIGGALRALRDCREREEKKYGAQIKELGRLSNEAPAPDPCVDAFRLVQEIFDHGDEGALELGEFREEIVRVMAARRAQKPGAGRVTQGFSLRAAALLGGLAVALGAFGAHALTGMVESGLVEARRLGTFETAVRYQMFHALALLALAALPGRLQRAAPFWLAGSLIFSGSLYALVLTGASWLGAVAPLGGALMILGWGVLLFSLPRRV